MILTIFSRKKIRKVVTSQYSANQACLFKRSLNIFLCEIFDHKAAFLLVKTASHTQNMGKNMDTKIWIPNMEKTYRYYRFKLSYRRVTE